jgi:two-component system, sensor histidine kinase
MHMNKQTIVRILLVDDSREDRVAFRRYLERCTDPAYSIAEAYSGENGLVQCSSWLPDCILLDYNLPDLNGVEFLSRLYEAHNGDAPAVVILTGAGSETLAVKCMKAGAQDYLVKGISLDRVSPAICGAIESIKLRRRVEAQTLEVKTLSDERANLIAELKDRAATLAEADRRKDEFLATLAHELRNPLAPIRTAMQVLKRAKPDEHTVAELSCVVERQISHLARLIDDLMDVARITNGKVGLHYETIALEAIISQAVEVSKPLFEACGHTLDVDAPAGSIMLHADPVRVVQILSNILANASKYTPDPGRISLEVRVEDESAIFVITDPGIGMEAASLSKIFAKFIQLDSSPSGAHSGLGIGLSLAKQFAEMHGGTIRPSSAGLRKGSQFVVALPVVVAQTEVASSMPDELAEMDASNHASNHAATAAPRHVLVVDDNTDGADMMQCMLEADGFNAVATYSGTDAVELVKKCKPDVVLMDLGMPGMDGYEAVRLIRQQPGGADILAIALTGWNQDDTVRRVSEAGFDHHLVKPVEYDRLRYLLQTASR